MVAISMYRGNLHRPPDVPRRWLLPTRQLSVKSFRSLLRRRTRALSHLRSPAPNPIPIDCPNPGISAITAEDVKDREPGSEIGDLLDGALCANDFADVSLQATEKPEVEGKPVAETVDKEDEVEEKEKKRKDVEDKLQVLNAKKHNLVQVLKQILNVEEELKRRSSPQCMASGPAAPLQVEVTNDSGSMTRQTPRIGSEANLAVENEVGEADEILNQNVHSRHVLRMSSMSPSSDSPLRRPSHIQNNVVPHPSRATLGKSSSPFRFAPTANPAQPGNVSSVSMSGTNYVASSPSPAASGGTSVFRDAMQPSPWN